MAIAMTKEWIQDQCKKYKQYRMPSLNDRLYLQNQGFSIIENLEEYTEVKTVYLECNCIESLTGLQLMTKLSNLVVHKNNIASIAYLDDLKLLDSLDLSDNMLTKLDNLACCPLLTSLNVSNNHLKTNESINHLRKCSNLKVLDLSKNKLEDGEHLLAVLKTLPVLSCLYLTGNPCLCNIPNYRKTIISSLPGLKHLDHTPVFWSERIYADAWAKGGEEGVELARDVVSKNKQEYERLQFEGMRRLREQAVQERMICIKIPLLQFDDDELDPKPFIYDNEEVNLSNTNLLHAQPEENSSKIQNINALELNPQIEWNKHMQEEIGCNLTSELNVTESNLNHQASNNVNDKSVCESPKNLSIMRNYCTYFDNDNLTNFDNKCISLDLGNLASVDHVDSNLNHSKSNEIISTFTLKDDNCGKAKNTTSQENLSLVEKNCIQKHSKTNFEDKELDLHNKLDDKVEDLLGLENTINDENELEKKYDITTNQACTPLYTLNGKNTKSFMNVKEQQDLRYIYPSDDDEPPIPRFLNISKANKPANLAPTNPPDMNQNFESKSIVPEKYPQETLEKEVFEIKEENYQDKVSNCEKLHIDVQTSSNIFTKELTLLQNYNNDEPEQCILHKSSSCICKKNNSMLSDIELEPKNIETFENEQVSFETKFDLLSQEETIDNRSEKEEVLKRSINVQMDEVSHPLNIMNDMHLNPQYNISTKNKLLPHSLNFKKLPKNKWTFDDIPSKICIEIQNVSNESETNHDCNMLDHHNMIVSQQMVEQLEIHVKDEWKRHVITLESICGNSKVVEDESCICTHDTLAIDDKSKQDFFAQLECTLLPRMNHNLHFGHQQEGLFNTSCHEEDRNEYVPLMKSKRFQLKNKELLTIQHLDKIVDEEGLYIEQSARSNVLSEINDLEEIESKYLENEVNKKQIIPLSVEEIVSPISTCNLLRMKSLMLSQNATLEISRESSDTTSLDDQSDSFYDSFSPVFDIEPSIDELNKTMSPLNILEFQSNIQFNPIFEHD